MSLHPIFFFSSLLFFSYFSSLIVSQPAFPTLSSLGNAPWAAREVGAFINTPSGSFFVLGGWISGALPNDCWRSVNGGSTWTLMHADNAANGWIKRNHFAASYLATAGKLVMGTGFDGGSMYSDMYTSNNDGASWTRTITSGAFVAREGALLAAKDANTIILIGGNNGATYYNDVWSSTDATTWTRKSANAPWPSRSGASAAPFNSRFYVMGGENGSGKFNDIWSTNDGGSTWSLEHSHGTAGSFPPVSLGRLFVWSNTLYIVTGVTSAGVSWNGVYLSTTGNSFSATTSITGPSRHFAAVGLYSNNIVLMGGSSSSAGSLLNDVWSGAFPSIAGDPTFMGFNGARYQVHGSSGRIYNLITSQKKNDVGAVQINARFSFLSKEDSRDLVEIRQQLWSNNNNNNNNNNLMSVVPLLSGYTVDDLPRTAAFHHSGNYLTQIAVVATNPLYHQTSKTGGSTNNNNNECRDSNEWIKILVEAGRYERGLKVTINGKHIHPHDTNNNNNNNNNNNHLTHCDRLLLKAIGLDNFITPFSVAFQHVGDWLNLHIDNADHFLNIQAIDINQNAFKTKNNISLLKKHSKNHHRKYAVDERVLIDDGGDDNVNINGNATNSDDDVSGDINNASGNKNNRLRVLDGLIGCSYGVDESIRLPLNDIDDYLELDDNLFGQNFAVNLLMKVDE